MRNAPIAQPDRVFGYEPKGRGFESLLARQRDAGPNSFWVQRYFFALLFRRKRNFLQHIFKSEPSPCLPRRERVFMISLGLEKSPGFTGGRKESGATKRERALCKPG